MEALVTIEQLAARLPFVMDADELREGSGALDDLSDDARTYGKLSWTIQATTPRQVRNLILRAAVRHMKNPDGFTQSRAGDETLGWTDRGEDAGAAYFTDREIKMLRLLNGKSTFHSVDTTAWGPTRTRQEGLVPDEGSNEPIQMFSSDNEPW